MRNTGSPYCPEVADSRLSRRRLSSRLLPLLFPLHCLLFCLLPALALLASCSIDDDRDECCQVNIVRFRYLYQGNDRFKTYIHSTRYFLFDGEGSFLTEMDPLPCCPARVDIAGLEPGSYTLIALGNYEACGTLQGHTDDGVQDGKQSSKQDALQARAAQGLQAFRLALDNYHPEVTGAFRNSDRLYWGECPFTVAQAGRNEFLGEMSNVHCWLYVRVAWEGFPPFREGYRFRLEGVGIGMELHGTHATAIDVHRFPPVESYCGSLAEDVAMYDFMLTAPLVTLRWTDEQIPRFRLYHGDTPVTKEIDLGPIFRRWNWYPDKVPVQEYEIRMLIHSDGSIEINQGLYADVGDWEDGGTVG